MEYSMYIVSQHKCGTGYYNRKRENEINRREKPNEVKTPIKSCRIKITSEFQEDNKECERQRYGQVAGFHEPMVPDLLLKFFQNNSVIDISL